MSRNLLSILVLTTFAVSIAPVNGDDDTYINLIKPVLKSRCYACHGVLKQESGLRLDTAKSIKQLTDNGKTLLQRVTSPDSELRMPPEGTPLSPIEITTIRNWVARGAPAPENELPEESPEQHWSFIPPVEPQLTTSKSPIDELIERQYRQRNIKTERKIAKDTILLRRVYLDLIGIPPTP
ncbi:MAG: c-type cytochrome domain-containing protein, partial [Planctomycetota bacterium]|nr:c-type cytochrome domain-containing protein [Planctomycetota bacterium]